MKTCDHVWFDDKLVSCSCSWLCVEMLAQLMGCKKKNKKEKQKFHPVFVLFPPTCILSEYLHLIFSSEKKNVSMKFASQEKKQNKGNKQVCINQCLYTDNPDGNKSWKFQKMNLIKVNKSRSRNSFQIATVKECKFIRKNVEFTCWQKS